MHSIRRAERTLIFLTVVVLALCMCSCTSRKRDTLSIGEEEIPDLVMTNASYSFGRKADNPVVFEADKITIWSENNARTELENVKFSQNGKNRENSLFGRCDSAVVKDDNSVATMKGNIRLEKKDDDLIIECEDLVWNDSKSSVVTEGEVLVWYGKDMYIRAKGFSAEFKNNVFEFSQVIEGTIETGSEDDEEDV